ncbi:MAG: hypothetical protein II761_04225, partial [Bacteroidales bacterium]|nr:hypothetical protein [Bacteroidales bacterium]
VLNALGVVAMRKGDYEAAAKYFKASKTDASKANQGVVDLLTGNYEKAAQELADVKGCCNNTALAYILTDQLEKAEKAIHCECGSCLYMKAIIAARKGDATGVQKNLAAAYKKDASLRERAANDIEFAGYDL